MLREGTWADVVVYDMKGLGVEPDWVGEIVHDLPGGEWRRVQRATRLPLDHRQRCRDLRRRQLHRTQRRASSCVTAARKPKHSVAS